MRPAEIIGSSMTANTDDGHRASREPRHSVVSAFRRPTAENESRTLSRPIMTTRTCFPFAGFTTREIVRG